jgi:alkylated DNA repair protein (DNA oxidative demethylase)
LAREPSFCAISRAAGAPELVATVGAIAAVSPFRHMVTPGGWQMSVALTNCG